MKAVTALAIAALLFVFAVMALFVLAIWTGDGRWGWTGAVLILPVIIFGAAAGAMSEVSE